MITREPEDASDFYERAADEFEAGDLSGEFAEALSTRAADFANEATDRDWNVTYLRIATTAPRLFGELRAAVIADRVAARTDTQRE
jgi:hypothetical protein